jgi:hypothetical protein
LNFGRNVFGKELKSKKKVSRGPTPERGQTNSAPLLLKSKSIQSVMHNSHKNGIGFQRVNET